jgi:UDP-glucose 4-epimerase
MELSVIVTGASGFIGSALVDKLKSCSNFNVIPVSRHCKDNLFIKVDNYKQTPKGDVLVHLAENPYRIDINQNCNNCINESGKILDALIDKSYKKIIYCSSSAVYGEESSIPLEEKSFVYSNDNYSKLKLDNEKKIIDTGGIVVRLANVIGPGMSNKNVLSDIINQIQLDGPVRVRNGAPIRDFIWIDDVVTALEVLISKADSGVFNIGSGKGLSIIELAEEVLKVSNKNKSAISMDDSGKYSYNVLNISKMKKLLGWTPKFSLTQSIKLIIKEYE